MKSSKAYNEDIREIRNLVLLNPFLKSQPPEIAEHENAATAMHLGDVMNEIQEFIDILYEWDVNPLAHLRKYFPNFIWKYEKSPTLADLFVVVTHADYAWLDMPNLDWESGSGVITATQIKRSLRTRRSICLNAVWPQGGVMKLHRCWPEEELRKGGVKFLSFDPNHDLIEIL